MRAIVFVVVQSGGEGNNQTDSGKKDDCFSLKLFKKCHCFSVYHLLYKKFFQLYGEAQYRQEMPACQYETGNLILFRLLPE
ncbi:MAG: hypothetical protein ABFD75_10360 [Smithella sp.]